MFIKVSKRNSSIVDFDDTKIFNAIYQANEEVKSKNKEARLLSDKGIDVVVDNVIKSCSKKTLISVEEIQNIVERELVLYTDEKLSVSRKYYKEFREKFAKMVARKY